MRSEAEIYRDLALNIVLIYIYGNFFGWCVYEAIFGEGLF